MPGEELDDTGIDAPGNLILVRWLCEQDPFPGVGQEPGFHHDGGALQIPEHEKILRLSPAIALSQAIDQLLLDQGGQAVALSRTWMVEDLVLPHSQERGNC